MAHVAAMCTQLQYLSTLDVRAPQTDPSAIASLARHHSNVTILFADIVGECAPRAQACCNGVCCIVTWGR